MSDFLRQLGCAPWLYWLAATVSFGLWFASAALLGDTAGGRWSRLNRPAVFGVLLLGAMLAWRWPGIFYFRPVNPDEAEFLAGALTMLARGQVWWVDGTTSGPLVMLPLTLPGLCGLPVDYGTGRIVGLLLNWGTVMFAYLALRHIHGDRRGRLLVLPLAGFFVLLEFWDFVPYCSEIAPVFLCALAAWLCLTAFGADGVLASRRRLAAGGLVLGLLPFSKFQVLPLGAALGLSVAIWLWRQPGANRGRLLRDLLVFTGGLLGGAGLLLLSLARSGVLGDFHQSYWVHNLHYAGNRAMAWTDSLYALRYLSELSWGFAPFHYGLLLLLGLSLTGLRGQAWRPLLLGWLLLLAAYCAVLAPGRLYPHYLLLLSLPLALLVGLQFGGLVGKPEAGGRRRAFWILFLVLGLGAQLGDRLYDRQSLQRLVRTENARTRIVGFINQVKRPGDALAVWGWRPELYVETQLPQATREAHTDGQLQDTPQRDYFRARFLADVQANRPAFFIDAVGPEDYGHPEVARDGHETFAALAEYVRREYQLVSKAAPIRVYARRALLDDGPAAAKP